MQDMEPTAAAARAQVTRFLQGKQAGGHKKVCVYMCPGSDVTRERQLEQLLLDELQASSLGGTLLRVFRAALDGLFSYRPYRADGALRVWVVESEAAYDERLRQPQVPQVRWGGGMQASFEVVQLFVCGGGGGRALTGPAGMSRTSA